MKTLFFVLVITLVLLLFPSRVFAQSDYVLPYPAQMPGNRIYEVALVIEHLSSAWHFGNLSRFAYNLKYADKYLVEAKTLFEYKQYLLGVQALKKSDTYFTKAKPFLLKAKKDGVDTTPKELLLSQASIKHREVLEKMKESVPVSFVWQPEKSNPTVLGLHDLIHKSIQLRTK